MGAGEAERVAAPCASTLCWFMVVPLLTLVVSDKVPFIRRCVPQDFPLSSCKASWPEPRKWAWESGGDSEGYVPFLLWGQVLREALARPADTRMGSWRPELGQVGCLPKVNTGKSTLSQSQSQKHETMPRRSRARLMQERSRKKWAMVEKVRGYETSAPNSNCEDPKVFYYGLPGWHFVSIL